MQKIKKSKNRKAQAWGIDLMAASVIFIFGIIMFYLYALNEPSEGKEIVETMSYEGEFIARSLLSEGYPSDWNSGNVIKIGILSENKINQTKLERFYEIAALDYEKTKRLFNTRFNYYFFLSEKITIDSDEVEGLGEKPENYKNLFKVTRFTIYNNKPSTMTIYIWES